jgi:Carboxypeptidase regulatory-like domain
MMTPPTHLLARRPRAFIPIAVLVLLAGALAFLIHGKGGHALPASGAAAAGKGAYRNRALFPRPAPGAPEEAYRRRAITGFVYGAGGEAIAGAKVSATTFEVAGNIPSVAGSARSDARGRFELSLAEGTYQLDAHMDGYGPSTTSAQTGEMVSLVLPHSGAVAGHVRDEEGRPVRRFVIDVVSATAGDAPASPWLWSRAFESEDGSFRAAELPAWPILLRATAEGRAPALSSTLAVKPGEQREVDLTMAEGCALEGTVQDRAGNAISGVLVNAEERLPGSIKEPSVDVASPVRSGDGGRFRIAHVPRGTIVVRGYDGDHAPSTETVEISDCARMAQVKLVMSRGGSIAGVARRADGTPLPGARVAVSERSLGIVNAWSDGEGRFRFDDLPATGVRLELDHGGQTALKLVGVKGGETVNQDLALFPEGDGELRGRVVGGSQPIAGARLLVASNRGRARGIALYMPTTGEDGAFRVPALPEGAYLVTVLSTPEGQGVHVEAGEVTKADFDVSKAQRAGEPR